ncbi:MAG: Excinuclease ABC subunit C [Candidatus Roizmanbacteria bacterium GW2011_GWC2_37_13]|uniref:Excinuclease ABC subunit C n=1 Tax=Candidatus Roizmanbacteria bacterium GW2011_GWC2_37_13 TaxID=1618486 RepID=A0A0G0IKI3_9BACT|nr:MAG: Excinuclease ABC subunit C [Candidatus Roizmanbacteria bacterium GW2011_GWC1_37_12]KKQ24719.1 MAG: Excinuclease ABC subunit C [Candidatus Roizmanbacteria bacterium GW2011_GWC2_37_13]
MIEKNEIDNLPSNIGVYFFKKDSKVLYIGKSVNIKARVRSHLENAKLDRKESLIVESSDRIEAVVVENEFKALILESQLIKKFHPKYNVVWKDGKSYLYIKITTREDYPKVLLSRKPDFAKASSGKENDGQSLYFGPFSSTKVAESLLDDIRHIVPFCTEKNLSRSSCFYSKIGLCQPCPNFINNCRDRSRPVLKRIYRNNIRRVVKVLHGGVTDILNNLYKQLKSLTKEKKYEEAIFIRNKIFRLERLINHPTSNVETIHELSLQKENHLAIFLKEIKKYFPTLERLDRIEAYDISNLQKSNQVGSMVVLTKGVIDKDEYRRFRIKDQGLKSDFDRLKEVIRRRFKNAWQLPNLIIVDGGRPQVRVVMETLKEINQKIPVLGIAKNPDRLVIGTDGYSTIRFPQTNKAFNIIRLIRDESHRFAKKYHLYLRKREFLV